MFEAVTPWDAKVLHAIHAQLASPAADAVMAFFTLIGNHGAVWLLAALALAACRRTRPWGIGMLVMLACAGLFGELLIKYLIGRPRPFLFDPALATSVIGLPGSPSFPSMHAGSSFASAAFLAFVPLGLEGWRRTLVRAAPFVLAALIAASRLYFAVHFPTDVAAGVVFGLALGMAAGFIAQKTIQRAAAKACAANRTDD